MNVLLYTCNVRWIGIKEHAVWLLLWVKADTEAFLHLKIDELVILLLGSICDNDVIRSCKSGEIIDPLYKLGCLRSLSVIGFSL